MEGREVPGVRQTTNNVEQCLRSAVCRGVLVCSSITGFQFVSKAAQAAPAAKAQEAFVQLQKNICNTLATATGRSL